MRFREFTIKVEEWLDANLCEGAELVETEGESAYGDPEDGETLYPVSMTFRRDGEGFEVEETWDLEELYAKCREVGWFVLRHHLMHALQEGNFHNRPKTTEECEAMLEGREHELFVRLCEMRTRIAAERQLSVFIVLPNRTVMELVKHRPLDEEALLMVPGIGHKKARLYGEAILDVIREVSAEGDSR